MQERFVGIDVSKQQLDVAVRPESQNWTATNDEPGIRKLVASLKELAPKLIIIEASGGQEAQVITALAAANLPVVLVNPRCVRDFAKALGKLAKTDTIDAEVLAHFGEAVQPEQRSFKDEETQAMADLVKRRRQLVDMLTEEKNRLHQAPATIQKNIKANIKSLEKCLKGIEKDLRNIIKKCPVWEEKNGILRSVPGVGEVLSCTILADLPELGMLNRRQVSALVGVAPLNRDSGKFKGQRRIWGGRGYVRHVLYMATVAAIRCNQVIREFYERLIKVGKKPKVAITACMHKLLIILNSMMKHGTKWQPQKNLA